MTVYLVWGTIYHEESTLIGVYADREKAEEDARIIRTKRKYDDVQVDPHDVE